MGFFDFLFGNKDDYAPIPSMPTPQAYDADEEALILDTKAGVTKFNVIAGVAYKQRFFFIVQPDELLDGMSDDEAFVFEYKWRGGETYEFIEDDRIINAVFKKYDMMLRGE